MRPQRAAARRLAVLILATVIVVACDGDGNADARDELRRAVAQSLDEPMVRSERRIRGQGIAVEEYIAPDRSRSVLPPSDLPGIPAVSTVLIVVGDTTYIQDSQAEPPNDELFVACQQDQPGGPEIRGLLALVGEATDVRQVADERYVFRVPDDVFRVPGDVQIEELVGVRGEATVSRGRVSELRLRFGEEGREAVWSLTFDEVAPITVPADDQIVRHDCQVTSGELMPPPLP